MAKPSDKASPAYKKLVERLKEERKSQRFTLRDIAEKTIFSSHSTLFKVENLERWLQLDEYFSLCETLTIDSGKLWNECYKPWRDEK